MDDAGRVQEYGCTAMHGPSTRETNNLIFAIRVENAFRIVREFFYYYNVFFSLKFS